MAPLKIGVMMEAVQISDIMGADILGNLSTEYIKSASELGLGPLLPHATEMEFLWLSTTLEPAIATPGMRIVPNITYDDCPRDLDILLIGGPLPSHRPASADKFLKEAFGKTKVILTTCVGSMWLASAGVLEGKKATTNRLALPVVKELYPQTEWLDRRWVVDGNLWTSGGAGAGIDMIAEYARKHFQKDIVDASLSSLDIEPVRGQFYT